MSLLNVNFEEASQVILIDGPNQSLRGNPLFSAFLRKRGGIIKSEERIEIPCEIKNLRQIYRSLEKILAKNGISLAEARELSGAMAAVRDDEAQFAEFSRNAEMIWHRHVATSDFKEFVSTVSQRCPRRIFYRLQVLSAFHLAFSHNTCNFSVPGAGKTSIVYAAYAYLNSLEQGSRRHLNHILVVGPLSSFKAWEDEFREIFGRPARAKRISGIVPIQERRSYLRGLNYQDRNKEITLTSYQSFMSFEEDFQIFLRSNKRRVMLVLDEAHHIKREDGQWASSILRAAPAANSRVVLTGTPAPNGYEDLFNLFRFIYPDRNVIGFPVGTLQAMSSGQMPYAIERLKHNIRPFSTRIKKSDLNLPPFSEERVVVTMGQKQGLIYSSIEKLIVPRIRDDLDRRLSTLVRARLIRLRQAATNPSLLLGPLEADGVLGIHLSGAFSLNEVEIANHVESFQPCSHLEKLKTIKRIASRVIEDEGKLLVWSYFLGNLAMLRDELQEFADRVFVISGATPVADSDLEEARDLETREGIIQRFHKSNETAILIANPQAVGESISLHKAADTAVYFDRDFNAGKFIQSKDRIHRYDPGPPRPKKYIHLVSGHSVEGVIDERLSLKEKRMLELIDSDDIPLFDLSVSGDESVEDIRAIIRAYERRKTI